LKDLMLQSATPITGYPLPLHTAEPNSEFKTVLDRWLDQFTSQE